MNNEEMMEKKLSEIINTWSRYNDMSGKKNIDNFIFEKEHIGDRLGFMFIYTLYLKKGIFSKVKLFKFSQSVFGKPEIIPNILFFNYKLVEEINRFVKLIESANNQAAIKKELEMGKALELMK